MSDKWKVYKGSELSNADYHGEKEHSSSSNIKDLITEKPGRWHKEGQLWGVEKYYEEKVLGNKKPQEQKNSFDEGSLAHCMILEPHFVCQNPEYSGRLGCNKTLNSSKGLETPEISRGTYKQHTLILQM